MTCLIDEYIDDFRFLYFKFGVYENHLCQVSPTIFVHGKLYTHDDLIRYMMLPPILIYIVYRGHKSTEADLERAIRRELDEQDTTVIHP